MFTRSELSYTQEPLKTQMINALLKVAKEEKKRAIDKFEQTYGRPYDGSSNEDWDLLDKTYTNLFAAVSLLKSNDLKSGTEFSVLENYKNFSL